MNENVSVCCGVNVGLVHGCEWHWPIFGEAPYSTSFLSENSMWFLQMPAQAHSQGRRLGITTGASRTNLPIKENMHTSNREPNCMSVLQTAVSTTIDPYYLNLSTFSCVFSLLPSPSFSSYWFLTDILEKSNIHQFLRRPTSLITIS